MRGILAMTLVLVVLAGCGGGSSSNTGPTTSVNLTGNYQANIRSNRLGLITGTASIQQNGSTLSGSYSNSRGGTSRITGTVSGSNAHITLTGTNNPSICNADISVSADGQQGNGTYSCNDGDSGQFTLTRT